MVRKEGIKWHKLNSEQQGVLLSDKFVKIKKKQTKEEIATKLKC